MKKFLVLVLALSLCLVGCKEEIPTEPEIEASQTPDALKNVEPHIATLPEALQLVLVDAERIYDTSIVRKGYFWGYRDKMK